MVVGEILDVDQVDMLYEIKTSIRGRVQRQQKLGLQALVGRDKVKLAASLRRWSAKLGWHDNPTIARKLRVLGLVGVASTAMAFVAHADLAEEFETVIEPKMIQLEGLRDPLERRLQVAEILIDVRGFLGRFLPDTTLLDALTVGGIYRALGP